MFGDPRRVPRWRLALDRLYERYLPHERRHREQLPAPMRVDERVAELSAGGWFAPVTAQLIAWQHRLTPAAAQRLWATFPKVRELEPARREVFLTAVADLIAGQPGGVVVDNYVTVLYTAQRCDVAP